MLGRQELSKTQLHVDVWTFKEICSRSTCIHMCGCLIGTCDNSDRACVKGRHPLVLRFISVLISQMPSSHSLPF